MTSTPKCTIHCAENEWTCKTAVVSSFLLPSCDHLWTMAILKCTLSLRLFCAEYTPKLRNVIFTHNIFSPDCSFVNTGEVTQPWMESTWNKSTEVHTHCTQPFQYVLVSLLSSHWCIECTMFRSSSENRFWFSEINFCLCLCCVYICLMFF